jgi:regulator of nucleoside diphosphate kinase
MLASTSRTLTAFDCRRLDALFDRIRKEVRPPSTLSVLEREVARATVVQPERVPPTVVTMNSQVELVDLDTLERRGLTVVFPPVEPVDTECVSVLAPLGTALLGSREGELLTLPALCGPKQLKIERVVYQPEASGRFDL